jgi:anti-sigma regulatory factor (Ser/Thr protein kinase)
MDVRTSTRLRRERAAVPSARAFVRQALRGIGAAADVTDTLVLAVAEACNNAILHATGEVFGLSLVVEGTRCTITVTDTGTGFVPPRRLRMPAPEATGHRGLALMQALVERVVVSSGATGTTVVLQQTLAPVQPGAPAVAVGNQAGRVVS